MNEKYTTQKREKRCMGLIVEMKERLPFENRAVFMKSAFYESFNAIYFEGMSRTPREALQKETKELIQRFQGF